MKRPGTQERKASYSRVLHTMVFAIAMISISVNSSNARAADLAPTDYRVLAAGGEFNDTTQIAAAFQMRPPRRFRARHLELAVGAITTPVETRAFVSLGPVWRLPFNNDSFFVDLGFSPTLISGSSLNGRDLGGNFHFTSSAAISTTFGASDSISLSLRVQHTSNGGLSSDNPGLDMIGLNIAFNIFN